MNFKQINEDVTKKCQKAFKDYEVNFKDKSEILNEGLNEIIRMNDGGKYLRATLIKLGYMASGHMDDDYINLAMAYELFQTSILIHDDIIDESPLRRNKITIHENYKQKYKKDESSKKEKHDLENVSNSVALCLGDVGLFETIKIINKYNRPEITNMFLDIALKTAKGEMLDVILPFKEEYFEAINLKDEILNISKLKTAYYSILGPYKLGLALGSKKIDNIDDPLMNLGIAFQIKDDILGIYGSDIGKSTTTDIEEYKQTLLYYYALNTSYKDEIKKNYGKKTKTAVNKIKKIFIKSGAKEKAEDDMNNLFDKAKEQISKLELTDKDKELLNEFIEYLEKRNK